MVWIHNSSVNRQNKIESKNIRMGEEEPARVATPQDRLAVYAAVKTACKDVGRNNTLVGEFSVEKEAVMLIAESVYRKLEEAAEDVEAFAGHAKRNNVNIEDVKLLFRKNKKIVEELKAIEEAEEKEKQPSKRKRTEDPEPGASTS